MERSRRAGGRVRPSTGRRLAATTIGLALLAVGCGGDGSGAATTTTAIPTTTTIFLSGDLTYPRTITPSPSTPNLPGEIATGSAADPVVPLHPWVIANRGASTRAPEHTFAAYDLAFEQGADFLKLDVRLTADDEVVVIHDATLDRTARGPAENCTGTVREKTLDQIRTCEVGSSFDAAFAGQRVPTLSEVLERYGTAHRYVIELGDYEQERTLERRVDAALQAGGFSSASPAAQQIVVQAYEAPSLQAMRRLRPDLFIELVLPERGKTPDPKYLREVGYYANGIAPNSADVDADYVAGAHAYCLAITPYTVDAGPEMTRLLDAGVDGIYTNQPDVLAPLVEGRERLDCR